MIQISRNRYYLILAFLVLALILMPAGAVMLLLASSYWVGFVLCAAAFAAAICGLVITVYSPPRNTVRRPLQNSASFNPGWALAAQSRPASSPTTSQSTHAI